MITLRVVVAFENLAVGQLIHIDDKVPFDEVGGQRLLSLIRIGYLERVSDDPEGCVATDGSVVDEEPKTVASKKRTVKE